MAPEKKYDYKFFFTPLFHCCFWIRDPRSGMGKKSGFGIRDKHPGSATLEAGRLLSLLKLLSNENKKVATDSSQVLSSGSGIHPMKHPGRQFFWAI
jgi:hypothetical protein